MAYPYYQQNYQGWGRSGFQLGPPPVPNFQPESAWSGYDYYRAHAINPSRSLFHSVLDRVRGHEGSRYVSTHSARSIHLRLYGGFLSLDRVMPDEIGSAAAYEAYRTWKHHGGSIFSPLGGHAEREREALVGLALAETSHLWHYARRSSDSRGLRDALEVAALTASQLYEKRTSKTVHFEGVGGMGMGTAGSVSSRDYAYTRPRRYSSSIPTVIRSGSPYIGAGGGGSPYASNIPPGPASMVGTPLSGYGGLAASGGSPLSASYGNQLRASPYAGGGVALPACGVWRVGACAGWERWHA
ncbi:hypothetical protein EIP91_003094 [Steccherinum ochraceum]|uniref:Uncharacterized protein n=1 Tax=Steccherinum ochraceum TaxID=92696 RepID=A0A4R0RH71_9APHY|nr:hypothetical protein EIP91_003094 [Steccherinum ochraceum]